MISWLLGSDVMVEGHIGANVHEVYGGWGESGLHFHQGSSHVRDRDPKILPPWPTYTHSEVCFTKLLGGSQANQVNSSF